MSSKIENIIATLQLQPHPEGGFFRETYRSQGIVNEHSLPAEYDGNRNYSTCIYFLLTAENYSAFHRVRQDEIWHFYNGSPLHLHMINQQGEYSVVEIGSEWERGQLPQFVVPGGTYFAANVIDPTGFSLVGCTVSPGFDFADFELANRTNLLAQFPHLEELIIQFTRQCMENL